MLWLLLATVHTDASTIVCKPRPGEPVPMCVHSVYDAEAFEVVPSDDFPYFEGKVET